MISLPNGSRVRAVVPPGERWLAMLHAAMIRLRLPVRDCVVGGGSLTVTIRDEARSALKIRLEPADSAANRLRLVGDERWALSYGGRKELDPPSEKAIDAVAAIMNRLAEKIPGNLGGVAAIVAERDDPAATLSAMFPFLTIERSRGPKGETMEVLVRTTSRCDQSCPFCSAPRLGEPPSEMVMACAKETGDLLPGATFSLTGGEPSLKSGFVDEVLAALKEEGIDHLQIQTNAAAFASRIEPSVIPVSGRASFFVSLHGARADVFDACTGTTGRLEATLRGIERLLEAGHAVTVNTVACSLNLGHLEELARALPAGPEGNAIKWHLSALICREGNEAASKLLVPYHRLVPSVAAASEVASKRGIEASSLLSSTHAAVPPCVLPGSAEDRRWLVGGEPGDDPGQDRAEVSLASDRMKADRCVGCTENGRCPGVPRAYGLRFGLDELKPITPGGS